MRWGAASGRRGRDFRSTRNQTPGQMVGSRMGKAALPGKRKDATAMDPLDCQVVGALRGPHGIDGIDTRDGPEHALFDERVLDPIDEGTVLNMMAIGVMQPIIIRKDGQECQVVVGRRRVLHAREANRRLDAQGSQPLTVLALNRKGNDGQMMGLMIAENEIRKQDSPLVKARKVQRILDFGEDEAFCALMFGVDAQTILSWLRLLDCDDKVLEAVEDGRLTSSAALPLAQLPRAEQREELEASTADGRQPSAKETRARAKARKAPPRQVKLSEMPGGADKPEAKPDVVIAPGKRVMKKVLKAAEDGDSEISDDVVKALKWVCGMTGPQTIKGLTAALRDRE